MTGLYRTVTGQSQKSQKSQHSHASKPSVNLTKTTTTDPYSGVLNHLTEAQALKLVEFKEKLEKEGWWTPDGINGKTSHDDGTLLRYLRARKFDVDGAYGQFTDTEKWLKEQRVEELYENFDVEHYEQARRMYPQWTGHRDKRGIPIYLFVIRHLDTKAVNKYQKAATAYKDSLPNHKKLQTPAKLLPLFALYHNLLNFVLPFVSSLERPNPEIPVTNSTNIVDITGVGLTQFWNLKNHMQDASVLATAHYPETLDRIFIVGAPAFFPTVWGWIKRWFDPVTVSKIFILSKAEVKPTLERFMDLKDIPKQYGGELDFNWGDLPNLDEESKAALEQDGNPGWVTGPCLWLDHKRVVVGSENGKPRRSVPNVETMKPVVYAADETEVPVHSRRRGSSVTRQTLEEKKQNGTVTAKLEKIQSQNVVPQTAQVAAATAVPAESNVVEDVKPVDHAPVPVTTSEPPAEDKEVTAVPEVVASPAAASTASIPSDIPAENIRKSPEGATVNMPPPEQQPAFPQQTAEYILSGSPESQPADKPSILAPPSAETTKTSNHATTAAVTGTAAAAAATATTATTLTNGTANPSSEPSEAPAPHAPSMPQPGPIPQHQVQLNAAIAEKLATSGESVSTLPAQANGALSHPEMVLTSDQSKGLALEKEKMEALQKDGNSVERPKMDRFVTAAEF